MMEGLYDILMLMLWRVVNVIFVQAEIWVGEGYRLISYAKIFIVND